MKKKFIALGLVASLFIGCMSTTAFAKEKSLEQSSNPLSKIEVYNNAKPIIIYQTEKYLQDGSKVIETLTRLDTVISSRNLLRSNSAERVTYEKTREYTATNSWVKLVATFSYDTSAKKVSCVSKYSEVSNLPSYKEKSLTSTGAGKTCTATLRYGYFSALGNKTDSISIKCNYKGNANV